MRDRALAATYIVAFFTSVALLTLHANMLKGPNRDEGMYVAAGALLARDGLIPYLDFPYFQMPNLAFLYAGSFLFNSHLLLSARLFSTLCALAVCAMLLWAAWRAFGEQPIHIRLLVGTGAVLLLVTNPIYFYASGLAWNHDPAVMFGLLSFLLYLEGIRRASPRWMGATGAALGLAVGTRLTFAAMLPIMVLLLLSAVARRNASPQKLVPHRTAHLALAMLAGCAVALLPSILLFALSPQRFLFNNVGYHLLNETYYSVTGYTRASDLPGKLGYLYEVATAPGNLLLLALTMLAVGCWLLVTGSRFQIQGSKPPTLLNPETRTLNFHLGAIAALSVAFSLILGALASSPTWLQYFYAPVPFLMLTAIYALSSAYAWASTRSFRVVAGFSALLAAIAIVTGAPQYAGAGSLFAPNLWVPLTTHLEGERLRDLVRSEGNDRRVLTISPLVPLEGGLSIYPAFASGPFAWRSGGLLTEEDRQSLGIVSGANLADYLTERPPAILTGHEELWEIEMVEYAQQHGYEEMRLGDKHIIWLATGP